MALFQFCQTRLAILQHCGTIFFQLLQVPSWFLYLLFQQLLWVGNCHWTWDQVTCQEQNCNQRHDEYVKLGDVFGFEVQLHVKLSLVILLRLVARFLTHFVSCESIINNHKSNIIINLTNKQYSNTKKSKIINLQLNSKCLDKAFDRLF